MIELFLFENDRDGANRALASGIRHFLVDWEVIDKEERQKGYDTEIRPGTVADLQAVSSVPGSTAWCRINRSGRQTEAELEQAIEAGAGGVFLPMVTSIREVEAFLELAAGRCETGILVETVEAIDVAEELARLPLGRVYFGLNDFAISRGGGSIFNAVLDGTVERAREIFRDYAFGFGGMTAIDSGSPLPARLLLEEMARLDCQYTFLRRSFRRDTRHRDPADVVAGIHAAWRCCEKRNGNVVRANHQELKARLNELCS